MLNVFVLGLLQVIQYRPCSYTCSGQVLNPKTLEISGSKMVFEFVVGKVVLIDPIFTVESDKLILKKLCSSFSGRLGIYELGRGKALQQFFHIGSISFRTHKLSRRDI